MDICTLNNTDYQVGITLIRRDTVAQEIPLDHVLKLSVINDSFEPFPRIQLIIKDPNSTIIPLYEADNNSFVGIKMRAEEKYGPDIRTIDKIHAFVINRVKPLNFSGESNTYQIDAVSEYYKNWMNPVQFSTDGNASEPATDIACKLLARADIPYVPPVRHSKYKCSFISDINSSVSAHVNRLLDLAAVNGGGFYYTWFNQRENTLKIASTNDIAANSQIKPYNIMTVPTAEFGSEDYYTPTSIEYTNDQSATKVDRLSRGVNEIGFDHATGEFTERRMHYTDLVNGSTSPGFDPVIDNTTNTDDQINYAQLAGGRNWFGEVRNAVRTYNGAMITIRGSSEREIGDLIIMRSAESLKSTFAGLWMNMRTVDEYRFGVNKYDQKIIMSRIGKIKD